MELDKFSEGGEGKELKSILKPQPPKGLYASFPFRIVAAVRGPLLLTGVPYALGVCVALFIFPRSSQ